MKILAFGGSSSTKSINRKLANYAASLIPSATVSDLDLNSFTLPIYSVDAEETFGIPKDAERFIDLILSHDAIILSLAEHNGSYTVAFKNILDWASRKEQKLWSDKPLLLLSTSPGGRGGATVLSAAEASFPHLGAKLIATFSLPSFYDNYNDEHGITDEALKAQLESVVTKFSKTI